MPAPFQDSAYSAGYLAPTSMEFALDGRLFVTEQGGRLRVHLPGNTSPQGTPFLTVTTNATGERGLLSVTLDPSFTTNGFVYVYYTATSPTIHNRVSRFTAVDADPNDGVYPRQHRRRGQRGHADGPRTARAARTTTAAPCISGRTASCTSPSARTPTRATPRRSPTASARCCGSTPTGRSPTDNPFFTQATGANRAIWALGLRNPYTFAFQPGTGRMFINDVGQSAWEEINDGIAGANYGWPNTEGYRTTEPLPTIGTYRDPVLAYGRAVGQTIAGGAFYNPPVPQFPQQYVGKYFFGDYGADWVRYVDPATNRPPINNFASSVDGAVDLDVGPDGRLYYLAINTGTVGRITYAAPQITTQPKSQAVDEGTPVTFTVVATGNGTLSYQWRRNGTDIPGATGASYTLDNPTAGDSGAAFTVRVTNSFGSAVSDPATLAVTPRAAEVVGRWVFYNNSAFDGHNPGIDSADDAAIATDKQALLPGQLATFSNVTSYSRGINGVAVDVAHLPATATITAGNFTFATGKGDGNWEGSPAPTAVTATPRRGAGVNGSDRIEVTFTDGAVANRWLRVTFTPTSGLGLAAPANVDVFYFGNLRGETGDVGPTLAGPLAVNSFDVLRTRRALTSRTAPVTSAYDFNRDGRVDVLDYSVTLRKPRPIARALRRAPTAVGAATSIRIADDVLR